MEMVKNLPSKVPDSVVVESVDKPSQCPDLMRDNIEEDCLAKCPISATKEIVDKSREECPVSRSIMASIKSQSLATGNEMLLEDLIVKRVLPNPTLNLTGRFPHDLCNFENAATFAEEVKKQLFKLEPCQPLAHHLDRCTFPRAQFSKNRKESWYKHILSNGTSIWREWLEYSPIKDSMFCLFLAHVWFSSSTYCGRQMGFFSS